MDAWLSPVAKDTGKTDHRASTLLQLSLSTRCDLRMGLHLVQIGPARAIAQRMEGCLSTAVTSWPIPRRGSWFASSFSNTTSVSTSLQLNFKPNLMLPNQGHLRPSPQRPPHSHHGWKRLPYCSRWARGLRDAHTTKYEVLGQYLYKPGDIHKNGDWLVPGDVYWSK